MNHEPRFDCRETAKCYYNTISQHLGYTESTTFNPSFVIHQAGKVSQDLSDEIVGSLPNIVDQTSVLEPPTDLFANNIHGNLPDSPPDSEKSEPYSPPEQLNNDQLSAPNYGLPIYTQTISNPTYAPVINAGGTDEIQNAKKRKIDDNLQQSSPYVKSERDTPNHCPSVDSDSGLNSLKFYINQDEKFHNLYDNGGNLLPPINFAVEADKGFIFSAPDDSFICQKKNHFQITVHVNNSYAPKFVATNQNNFDEIRSFHIHIYGNKREAKQQIVQVEQSQSDRTKKPFVPQIIELGNREGVRKSSTIGRLHFCDTTLNNQRKNGKLNPDQRYFLLNVALKAHTQNGNQWTICSMHSDKIIVRASNPSQFKQDVDPWQKVQGRDGIYSSGNVGIRNDKPEKALDVQGDVRVTGAILHPSDMRVKENIKEIDPAEQLEKVKSLQMYNFSYKEDYADAVGMEAQERHTTGVLAQQVKEVIPDAVHPAGDVKLKNGDVVENLQTVNKDRLYMEGLGAVQELCKVADNLQTRIVQIETFNEKLKQKRDSVRSTASSIVSSPVIGSEGSRARRPQNKLNRSNSFKSSPRPKKSQTSENQCSNRLLHSAIATLVFVMSLCLIAILTLYILERKSNKTPTTPPPGPPVSKPGTPSVTRITVRPTPVAPYVLIRPYCRVNHCEENCCKSGSGKGKLNNSAVPSGYDGQRFEFNHPLVATTPFSTVKDGTAESSSNDPKISDIMADPFFITYNMSLDSFCTRQSCKDKSGLYQYLIRLDKTIQFRNIIVNLNLKNNEDSVSWLCKYHQGTNQYPVKDCLGSQMRHFPFRDENKKDIWSLPSGYYRDTVYSFRISSKNVIDACDLPQTDQGFNFTTYNFQFTRVPSSKCPK